MHKCVDLSDLSLVKYLLRQDFDWDFVSASSTWPAQCRRIVGVGLRIGVGGPKFAWFGSCRSSLSFLFSCTNTAARPLACASSPMTVSPYAKSSLRVFPLRGGSRPRGIQQRGQCGAPILLEKRHAPRRGRATTSIARDLERSSLICRPRSLSCARDASLMHERVYDDQAASRTAIRWRV